MRHDTVLEMRLLLGLAVLLWTLASATGLAYDFQVIAEPGDVVEGRTITRFSPEDNPIAINNLREVVFMASVDGLYNWSIMTPNRFIAGAGKVVDGVVPRFENEDHLPSINDAGQVAYRGILDNTVGSPFGGGAIFVNDEIVAIIGDMVAGRTITGVDFGPVINNHGTVAFVAMYEGHAGSALFTQDELIVEQGQLLDDGRILAAIHLPQINDNGTIAFMSGFFGQNNAAIFTQDGLLVESGENIIGDGFEINSVIDGYIIAGDITPFGIDGSGEVAFWAVKGTPEGTAQGQALFTQERILVGRGAVVDGKTIQLFQGGLQFNDSGMLSYLAQFPEGKGLFVDDNLIVATGDSVEGRTVSDLHHIVGMNDRGDLAFLAHFADGGSAIVLATIPEPSTLMLFASGLVLAACRRAVSDWAKRDGSPRHSPFCVPTAFALTGRNCHVVPCKTI